jgi:hypothetical protein
MVLRSNPSLAALVGWRWPTVRAAFDHRGRGYRARRRRLPTPVAHLVLKRASRRLHGLDRWAFFAQRVVPAASSRGFYDHPTARVGDLEKLRADLRRVCTIDNQQFGNILFRRGARTLSQDLDRHFERLPLLVQRRYFQFDPCDRGD